jgi:hypothetical protein
MTGDLNICLPSLDGLGEQCHSNTSTISGKIILILILLVVDIVKFKISMRVWLPQLLSKLHT